MTNLSFPIIAHRMLRLAALVLLASCEPEPVKPSTTTVAPPKQANVKAKPTKPRQSKPYPGKRKDLATFSRNGVHLPGSGRPGSEAGELLITGNAAMDAEQEAALKGIGPTSSKEACLKALGMIGATPSSKLPALLSPLLAHPDAEVRSMALLVVAGYNDPALLPLAAKALGDRDVDVRLQALEVASGVQSAETRPIFSRALRDQDINVRQTALQISMDQPAGVRAALLREAGSSPAPDLALAALSLMESAPDKSNVPSFIQALNHRAPEVREMASEVLELTFHQSFTNAGQASGWWAAQQHRFSQNLVEETPLR